MTKPSIACSFKCNWPQDCCCIATQASSPSVPDVQPQSQIADSARAYGVCASTAALLHEAAAIMEALMRKSDCALDRNAEFFAVSAWKIKARGDTPLMQPLEALASDSARAGQSEASISALPARTPQDFAIEHAEYMAKGAEWLLDRIDLEYRARIVHDMRGTEWSGGILRECADTTGEAAHGLRSCIYEFRKRRDRAACIQAAGAQKQDELTLTSPPVPQPAQDAQWMEEAWRLVNSYTRTQNEFSKNPCGGYQDARDQVRAALLAHLANRPVVELSDDDVHTLIGHAEFLKMRGLEDMPAYFYQLAVRMARAIGDTSLAERTQALAASKGTP